MLPACWPLVVVEADVKRAHLVRVKTALHYADVSQEKAALWMEMDTGQLSRHLSGDGHLALTRLMKLPPAFWQWYALLLAEDYGLPSVITRAALVELAVLGRRKRMAKVDPEPTDRRQVS